ncbi:MAG TPA: hypothetical protein PK323_00090 [Bacteroidia bacterium]|nr:hypothetical protein [Bacteroidia bacterium]
MNKKIKLLFSILLISFVNKGFSQSSVVFDVFSNHEYFYQNKYKEVKDFELNLNGEFDIEYFAMRNEGGNNFERINRQIENLALEAWKDKQKKYELNNEIKAQIVKYNEFKLRRNNKYEQGVEDDFNPQLHAIDIKLLSVCNQIFTCYLNYEFKVTSNNNRYSNETVEINITKYFTFDVFTQKISQLKAEFNENNLAQTQQEVLPYVNQFFSELDIYFKENPDEVEIEDEEIINEEENETGYQRQEKGQRKFDQHKFDIKETHIYWFAWGMMISVPPYCKSSYISNGDSYSVFVPFEKCKNLLDLFPAYHSYKQLIKPSLLFQNFDYFEVLNDYNKFRHEPSVTSLFKTNNVLDKPKQLSVASYQIFKDNNKNHRGDFIYEFDMKANNFQLQAAKSDYSYFIEKNNGKTSKKVNKNNSKKSIHFYDEKGNLIHKKSDEPANGGDQFFFYNADNCYTFSLDFSNDLFEEKLNKISFKNSELCLTDVCLTFDKNMQVIAVKMLKYQHNDVELGFDEKGRLVEAHTENDRFSYYYEFDKYDRLIKYSMYEYQRVSKELIFYYKEMERLPYLQNKHTHNNDIFEEESYTWQY